MKVHCKKSGRVLCGLCNIAEVVPNLCQIDAAPLNVDGDLVFFRKPQLLADLALLFVLDVVQAQAVSLFFAGFACRDTVRPPGGFNAQQAQVCFHLLKAALLVRDICCSKPHLVTSATAAGHPAQALGGLFGNLSDALDLLLL